jgi:nitroreductase
MEKPAETIYPVHDLIRLRWSPLAFADRPVEPEKLQSLFEAARWSPSCFNEQPWRFIVCTRENPGDHRRFVECLVEGNVPWAQHAPVLMLSVAKRTFSHNGKPNRHAWHDVGLAVENLILQATALGLFAHQMGGYDAAKARAAFGIPEDYEPVAAIAVGYPGEADRLPAALQERERAARTRRPLDALIFEGQWDQPASLFRGR